MSNINKAAVLNPLPAIVDNIVDYIPRATTSKFGVVALGSGINVDSFGRIYLDTQEYSDRLAAIEAQAASSLATQQTEVAAAIAQVHLSQSQTITALTIEVNNLKTNLTDSITTTQTDLINRADQLAQNVIDITDQLALDKAAFTQEIQDALVYLENEASVASALRTPRKINGVAFDGTQDINLPVFTTELDGLVPKRVGTTTTQYLREDGTWVAPPDTTYPLLTGAIAEGGTATNANTISAKVLKDAIQYHAPPVTSITGNAGTATKLQTPRTINGISFDGTQDISLPEAVAYSLPTASASVLGGIKVGSGLAISNSVLSVGTLNQSTTGNAATATKLQTARTISLTGNVTGSVSFDGSANASIATSITGLGAANGIATLDSNGQVPSTQLPSYVDDVLEYLNVAAFPVTGETGKIYVETTGNTTYRWSGTGYVKITSGEVVAVAGKTGVVTLSKADVGLGSVDNTADIDKPVSSSTQSAIISAVSPKADKTYVDGQLALKANKVDVHTKQESHDLVNNSISTALNPVNSSLDLAKRGISNRYDSSLTYNSGERVVITNGDIVKSTIDGNSNDPNVGMTGWVNANAASQIFDESGLSQQEINNNGFVLIDSRRLGLVGGIEGDQSAAVTACNNYVNAIPIYKDTPVVLRLPKGLVRSSIGFAFDRQAILFAEGDSVFDYTGTGYAVRLGKLGEVDYTGGYRTFGIKGVSLTGGDNCVHGVYVAQYVLTPTFDNVKMVDFGNPNNSSSYCIFFQGHNWDIYIRNCKANWFTKNKVNLIRVNGVLTNGTPDYGNSRLNLIDNFYNQGFNASAGIGVYINAFKSRIIGGGFQGFKNSVQLGEYAQTVEVNGTYFETIYQDCESVFKIGEDGYTSEKIFSDLSLLNIYANLHNENNEFGNTNVKFLTTANNVKLSNLKIDNIKTLNGSKHPLLNLQEVSGQTCDVGNVSHGNALLHNIRDDQMVVMNTSKNYIRNSDFRVWQRGNSFTFNNGKKHLADGYTLVSDGTTGVLKVYNEPLLDAYNFNANAHGMMRLVRESATNAMYNTLRIRVGELDDLAGQFATFSFAAKTDAPFNLTATFVQDYGGGNIEYKSLGSITIDSIYALKNFARSFFVPSINRSTGKTGAARSYIDIALPLTAYVLDLSCITLEAGLVRKGWSSNSYSDELEFAKQYYQFGSSQSIQDQTRVQLDLRPVMRYSPASVVHVNYQDAVVDYNANINISDPDRIVYTLNARSQDVSVSWTADAEL